ncbi:MAG: type II toxin-antitoxin system VapC family toxin [Gammaproteobacteria bacterium]|nr:type II toxin-antitoxin system VapC family toxin [Gammaproteobacteria bacterium]
MKGLDTNVLIRYLVQDNLKQSAQATCFIEEQCTDESPCFIGHITLCEMAWVLDSCYGEGRKKIAAVIEKLLQVNQLEVLDPAVVWQAVNDYMKSNADFSDHLLARVNESQGCEVTVTFDKKAGKQPGFEAL